MNGTTSAVARFAHRIYQGHNSLARRGDRAEGVLLALVLLIGLLSVPVAAAIGSEYHAQQMAVVAQQTSSRVAVTAVLTGDAPTATQGMSRVLAPATWTRPDGGTGSGSVDAPSGAATGSRIVVWLDRATGAVTTAPLTPGGALLVTLLMVSSLWLVGQLVLAMLFQGTVWLVRRVRMRQWEREWAVVGPKWLRRTP